jgi:hypothetical protein
MGIKKDKLLRLGHKLLPLKVKHLLVRYGIVKGVDDVRKIVCADDEVIEFYLTGFNDNGLEEAFKHIMNIYDMYLKDDPNWHFIYEDSYTLIRCSYKYVKDLEKYFNEHAIEYKSPTFWKESTYVTTVYKEVFKKIFHWTSVLTIQMAKNEEEDFYIQQSADRLAHIFLLQSIYLAEINGDLDKLKESGYDIMYWEAGVMSNLAKYRSYNIGQISGQKKLVAYWKSKGAK